MQTRLTAAEIRRLAELEPRPTEAVYFDTVLPRFALRVKPPRSSGGHWASWYFVRYVGSDGRDRKLKVGSPATLSLDEARRVAKQVLARVDSGGDPARDKDKNRAARRVSDAVDAYLQSGEFAKKGQRTQAEDRATARLHIAHHLGREILVEVDVPMVRRLIKRIETDTRVNNRKRRLGGAGAARRAVRLLSAILTWEVGEGRLTRNLVIGGIRMSGGGQREAILDSQQLAQLFRTMDDMVLDGTLRPVARAFIICAALTGCRRNELRLLQWNDVDLERRLAVLRQPKGARLSRSSQQTETVSLPPIAASAIAGIQPGSWRADQKVFAPQRGQLLAINRDWKRVRDRAGLSSELVLHSLRHSLGTAGIIGGLSTLEVAKMLRHRNPSATTRYVHLAEARQSRLQDRAAAILIGVDAAEGWPAVLTLSARKPS